MQVMICFPKPQALDEEKGGQSKSQLTFVGLYLAGWLNISK